MKNEGEYQEGKTRKNKVKEGHQFTAAFHFPAEPPYTDAGLSALHWEVEHPPFWQKPWISLILECVLKESLNQLWRKPSFHSSIFFSMFFFLSSCSDLSVPSLPCCWHTCSALPALNLTQACSSFYISPSSFSLLAVSFLLPELTSEKSVVAEA